MALNYNLFAGLIYKNLYLGYNTQVRDLVIHRLHLRRKPIILLILNL